jgi:hypothetical protein
MTHVGNDARENRFLITHIGNHEEERSGLPDGTVEGFHFHYGSVEKSRQRRSRHFSVLTYYAYAPRVKMAAALLDGLF